MTIQRGVTVLLALAMLTSGDLTAQQPEDQPADTDVVAERRGWLGFAYDADDGVVVRRVLPGSPAFHAGLARGDTIVRVGGSDDAAAAIAALAGRLSAGDTVRLRVRRNGEQRTLTIVAAPAPAPTVRPPGAPPPLVFLQDSLHRMARIYLDSARAMLDTLRVPHPPAVAPPDSAVRQPVRVWRFPRMRPPRSPSPPRRDSLRGRALLLRHMMVGERAVAGAELAELNPGLARHFPVDDGLLVLRVADGSPADRAGLEAGDVIAAADGEPVRTVRELRRLLLDRLTDRQTDPLRLTVVRDGERVTLRLAR